MVEGLTDIGAALLKLLTEKESEWEFLHSSEAMRHPPTGIAVSLSIKNRVILLVAGAVRDILSDADHVALFTALEPIVDKHRVDTSARDREVMRRLLNLE